MSFNVNSTRKQLTISERGLVNVMRPLPVRLGKHDKHIELKNGA
jgi:hypothetical protein